MQNQFDLEKNSKDTHNRFSVSYFSLWKSELIVYLDQVAAFSIFSPEPYQNTSDTSFGKISLGTKMKNEF